MTGFSKPRCIASKSSSFSAETCTSLTFTGFSSPRRMVLYSSTGDNEQSFLPSIADNNGSKRKHGAEIGAKEKGLRINKKQKDAPFVRLPEVAMASVSAKNLSKSFARKSSSPKITFKTNEMLKRRQSGATKSTSTHEKRRGDLQLPSLVSESSVTGKPVESWSTALGLRDSYEIPRGLLNKLTDDILKIDRQMREEAAIQQIREKRIISPEWRESMKPKLSSSGVTFGRTSLPGFSYFPSLTRSAGERPGSMAPHLAGDKIRERTISQEQEIQRKMKEFKHRHSKNSKYNDMQ